MDQTQPRSHSGQTESVDQLNAEIDALKRQLRDAQRMAALGELLGTTTHEFNNILMSVINYAKMGLRHKDDATRTKSLEKILAAGERAGKISKSVLGAARNRSETPEPTDVAALVQDVMLLLERELRKYRISVEFDIQPVPPAMVVGNQIQQVLINLLVNARQAMSEGGRMLVRIKPDAASNMIELTVRDWGSGIAPEKLPHIFDRFFTTKTGPDASGKGGTGLGLSACKDIIDAHGGRIRVESSLGKGTAFIIRLPVATTATTAVATNPTSIQSPPSPTPPA